MKSAPLVRAGSVLPAIDFLREIGSPVERLLERAGLPAELFEHPYHLVPQHLAFEFVERAARHEGLDDLGLRAGEHASLDALPVLGPAIRSARTAFEALQALVRAFPLHGSGARLWLAGEADHLWLCHAYDRRLRQTSGQAQQFALIKLLQLARRAIGDHEREVRVQVPAPPSRILRRYEQQSGTQIRYGGSATAVALPRELLMLPLASPGGPRATEDGLVASAGPSAPARDFAGSVRQTIGALRGDGYPDVRLAARAVGMSVRTLQRRLAEQRISYSRLVEDERFGHATRLLRDPGVRITEIALELGYGDVANFTHAFRRWTGTSPSMFRRAQRQEGAQSARARTSP